MSNTSRKVRNVKIDMLFAASTIAAAVSAAAD